MVHTWPGRGTAVGFSRRQDFTERKETEFRHFLAPLRSHDDAIRDPDGTEADDELSPCRSWKAARCMPRPPSASTGVPFDRRHQFANRHPIARIRATIENNLALLIRHVSLPHKTTDSHGEHDFACLTRC
jgi:hypothetical protein